LFSARPTLVEAMVTLTARASGSKKNRQDTITIGRPAKIVRRPTAARPMLGA